MPVKFILKFQQQCELKAEESIFISLVIHSTQVKSSKMHCQKKINAVTSLKQTYMMFGPLIYWLNIALHLQDLRSYKGKMALG